MGLQGRERGDLLSKTSQKNHQSLPSGRKLRAVQCKLPRPMVWFSLHSEVGNIFFNLVSRLQGNARSRASISRRGQDSTQNRRQVYPAAQDARPEYPQRRARASGWFISLLQDISICIQPVTMVNQVERHSGYFKPGFREASRSPIF